ncbi:MAG: hypothetical protein H6Q73_883 [Firmicutes bacterium]|nr:hypothetical protein [Bacillota bacterium]
MQIERYKEACQILAEIRKNPSHYLIIHYSCESLGDLPNGSSPRITSIAIRYVENGQTDSFSIHKAAERKGISLDEIKQHYNDLELDMLEEYMEYIAQHHNFIFIHWNMRDIGYGFKAIEHRFMVLQNKKGKTALPQKIPDTCKIDLSLLFVKKYGGRYIGDPRIVKLIEKNDLRPKDFLTGKNEAEAFDKQEYIKLHLSTLSKTRVFDTFLSLAIDNTLKTNSSWIQTHGYSPQALWSLAKEKWYMAIGLSIITMILTKLWDKFFGL